MGLASRVVHRRWVDEVGRDGLLPGGVIGHATIPICSLGLTAMQSTTVLQANRLGWAS
jgi:hypothetical protein